MYVLDSSAFIEVIEGYPHMNRILQEIGEAPLVTTSLCMHEILAGARSEKDKFILEKIFTGATILEHTVPAARLGAQIEQELQQKGTKINKMDVLIAAICKVHNAELITLDNDFGKIKGFKVKIIK